MASDDDEKPLSDTTPDKDILAEALDCFQEAESSESKMREDALDDIRFARLSDQWPEPIRIQRDIEGRPCHTVNRLPTFIRQVVNDARQNRPSLNTSPVDSLGDPITSKVFDGLLRTIQHNGRAASARDTALEHAVDGGFGYYGLDIDYARNDTFDLDIRYRRFPNRFAVYGDPTSQEVDSSDWMTAFVTENISVDRFKQLYPKIDPSDWAGNKMEGWVTEETVRRAEWWVRDEVDRPIVQLSDQSVVAADVYTRNRALYDAQAITVIGERTTKAWRVRQYLLTAGEVLARNKWVGQWIPIIPVYGEEVNEEGKRWFRSLIRDAKDAQRMFNYWRSAATELVALAPKVPWVGPAGFADRDPEKWASSNRVSHPYLEYNGAEAPRRIPLDSGPATGAITEAMNASDDMKAVMGLFDASLGARSNEVSGIAIRARKLEGDVGTFHFHDNLTRAVEHEGRMLLDLIPHIYTAPRIIRIMGEDGKLASVKLGSPMNHPDGTPMMGPGPAGGNPIQRVFDLSVGKYDVMVRAGPSFTTRREEAAQGMLQFIQAVPPAAGLIGDVIARNMDWPEADTVGQRLFAALPPALKGGPSPEMQQMQQQLQQMSQEIQKLQVDNQSLKLDVEKAQLATTKAQVDASIKVAKAELKAEAAGAQVEQVQTVASIKDTVHESEKQALSQQADSLVQDVVPEVQKIGEFTQQLGQVVGELSQKVDAMPDMIASTRKPRKGRAVKQSDGSWLLEDSHEGPIQ